MTQIRSANGHSAEPYESAVSVSIVIPLFGPEHFLTACLKAIDANTEGKYETVVVDNGTGYDLNGTPEPRVIVRNAENLGFAVASNQGASCSTGELLVMLNVDTEVQPGWLPPLIKAFNDPDVAIAGPRIILPDGSLQTSGIRTWHGGGSAGGEELKDDGPSRDVDGVTGACMMVRKSMFDALGQFDTRFVNGYEDVSLCLSVREAGHRIRYVRESLVVHHESAAGGEDRWKHVHQNIQTMNEVWGNR